MSGGGTGEHGFNVRLRDSQARKDFDRDLQANPGVSEVIEFYAAKYEQEKAERKARHEREAGEQQEYWARVREIERKTLNKKLMDIMWESEGATDAEKKNVLTLVCQYNPEMVDNVDVVRLRLQLLRSVIG